MEGNTFENCTVDHCVCCGGAGRGTVSKICDCECHLLDMELARKLGLPDDYTEEDFWAAVIRKREQDALALAPVMDSVLNAGFGSIAADFDAFADRFGKILEEKMAEVPEGISEIPDRIEVLGDDDGNVVRVDLPSREEKE